MTKLYVIVLDPEGGSYDGNLVTIMTRILFEGGMVYGHENLSRKFSNQAELIQFLNMIRAQSSGKFGRFTWTHT